MTAWRAYSGDRDGVEDPEDADWLHYNDHHEDWTTARDQLGRSAARLAADVGCSTCAWDGAQLVARLDALPPGGELIGEGDGNVYLLCRSGRTDFTELDAEDSAACALVKDQRP